WPPTGDWEVGRDLGVGETVYKLTEIVEFAARLALSPVGDSQMSIAIRAVGLNGRRLVVDDPRKLSFSMPYQSEIEEFPIDRSLSTEELVGHTPEVAIGFAKELFARFGWTPSEETLLGFLKPI